MVLAKTQLFWLEKQQKQQQAGAELCQAEFKPGQVFPTSTTFP
jgi:hypothetical protein